MFLQLLVSFVGIIAILQNLTNYRKSKQTLRVFIFWSIAWGSMIFIVMVPQATDVISKLLKIERPVDAVLYPSIVLLYYLVFNLYTKLEEQNKELTKIIRKEALKNPLKR